MLLSEDNYYTTAADVEFMSASQFKKFMQCPKSAVAELDGLYEPDKGRALTVGSYMDALWDGSEEAMAAIDENEIYTKTGKKRADIEAADKAFERAYMDDTFREYMSGEHQTIMTGEIAGIPFKIKMDSYFPGDKIVDLKYMKDMAPVWINGEMKPFCDKYDYPRQLAIYREIVKQITGDILPCYLAVITKEDTPRIEIVNIPEWRLDAEMPIIEHYAPIFQQYKEHKLDAPGCGSCEYCRKTYKITKPIKYEDLLTA